MIEWIKNLSSGQITAAVSLAAMLSGYILKTTGLLKKIRDWFEVVNKAARVVGQNIGVAITTKMNGVPVIGLFWENLIEPVIVVILETIPGCVFNFLSGITNGLREDKKEFVTKIEQKDTKV
jgi:hypothetical protein